ncbi:hypothetical protein AGLY_017750 [Aphis glycines]|uniref:DUF659 domain-containing protein n=1 Tax=Aphis glycines TaxID=307491 RepID=A0A6G0SUP1_APHGL|nr:hypothetical protein AGLY_017750 [Aphis glycines]
MSKEKLKKYVSEYGIDFSTDGHVLYCKMCEIKIKFEKKYNVSQHIKTDKHQKNVKRKNEQAQRKVQQLLTNQNSVKSDFNMDLCRAMVSANIPLNKLSDNVFRTFLEKYTGKSIPMGATLRKGYIDDIFNSTLDNMKMEIQQNKIWVSINETCDVEGRFIANVIVGILRPDCPGRIFLLHSEQLDKANHSTICKLFDKAMGIIWPDAAPYMVKAGTVLKNFYTKMIHVTCCAHSLHRIAEQIRGQFGTVDELISDMKKIFRKAPYRVEMFKLEAPGIKLPPEPIITRWGSWIEAPIYYYENFRAICHVVNCLNENDADSIRKPLLNYKKKNVLLSDSLAVVQNVQQKFSLLKGNHGKPVLTKLQTVFKKNNGLGLLEKISKILDGEDSSELIDFSKFPDDYSSDDIVYFKYAPITSVDVKRSFSAFKTILSNNRRAFEFENLRKHLIIQCNREENL